MLVSILVQADYNEGQSIFLLGQFNTNVTVKPVIMQKLCNCAKGRIVPLKHRNSMYINQY